MLASGDGIVITLNGMLNKIIKQVNGEVEPYLSESQALFAVDLLMEFVRGMNKYSADSKLLDEFEIIKVRIRDLQNTYVSELVL